MKPTFDEFLAIVNPLVDYYKEVEDLRRGGLDLTKWSAHQAIYKLYVGELIDKFGVAATLSLLKFCEREGVMTVNGFRSKENPAIMNDYYQTFIDEFCSPPKVCSTVIREGQEVDELLDEPKSCNNSTTDRVHKPKAAKSENVNPNKPTKETNLYQVNGKKVTAEEYNKAVQKMNAFKEVMSDSFADVFDQIFDKIFS